MLSGYKWEPGTGSCYKYHESKNTWREALAKCHAEGGHLTIINSQTESTVLKELFKDKDEYHAFIGFSHYYDDVWATINGKGWFLLPSNSDITIPTYKKLYYILVVLFRVLTGERLSEAGFSEWDKDEPNNVSKNEFCGSIHHNGLLNDAPCNRGAPFICEFTPKH
ncbi:hemolymph lipopolysaccharide-binding protein-like [Cydia pomonella]|uniref:hemolymph lipopolysaccharide-binding protein-like n=1 Tax=Cydia pomonella TaxID=82600 RepID=UPI002ADE08DB|nr:hemolymph lipopolysaccharide-binding protein-like [Cydia pomonella]